MLGKFLLVCNVMAACWLLTGTAEAQIQSSSPKQETAAPLVEIKEVKQPPLTPTQAAQRKKALTALGKIGDRGSKSPQAATKVLPEVMPFLQHSDSMVRVTAIQVIQKFGVAAQAAIPDLILLLQDKDLEVQKTVPFALAEMGYLAKDAVPQLKVMLQDDEVAFAAYWALGHVDRDTRTNRLQKLLTELQSSDQKMRDHATITMHYMKPQEVVPQLTKLLKHKNPDIRKNVESILAGLNSR